MKRLFIIIVLVCASVSLHAQTDMNSGRTAVFDFIEVPVNPRAASLGNSFVAIKNDPNAIFSNPACIISVEPKDSTFTGTPLSFGYTSLGTGINEGYISIGGPIPSENIEGAFGVAVQYISFGSFDGRDAQGISTGDFSSGAFSLLLAYAGSIPEKPISFGVGVKYIASSLVSGSAAGDYSSSAIAADLGVYFEIPDALMTFGLSALNIGSQLSNYEEVREPLPFNLQFGVSKKLERLPLTVHLAFHHLTRDREGRGLFYALHDFSIGGEFALSKVMRLRFGYENQRRHELKTPQGQGLAGFALGLGFNFTKLTFDYAMNIMGPAFSDIHRFGFAYQL